MNRPISVEPLSGFRIRLVYPDHVEGVIDLSQNVGLGVFGPLAEQACFQTVHTGKCSERFRESSAVVPKKHPKG